LTSVAPSNPRGGGPAAPPTPLRAWADPAFLRFFAANRLLRVAIALFRAGLLPREALGDVLTWSEALSRGGRRLWLRRRRR